MPIVSLIERQTELADYLDNEADLCDIDNSTESAALMRQTAESLRNDVRFLQLVADQAVVKSLQQKEKL